MPQPSATILFAENNSVADHFTPHFWILVSVTADLAVRRQHPDWQ